MRMSSLKLNDLNDLYVHELRDLFSAEKQLTKALPKMAKAASSPDLKRAFEEHLSQTEKHAQRLEKIMGDLDINTRGVKCEAMEGLIEEGQGVVSADGSPTARDAALICAAQRVEHYEIAGYGCARTFARQLGFDEQAQILQQILEEESAADEILTRIATEHINMEAMQHA